MSDLPEDGVITSSSITTGEYRTALDGTISSIARGNTQYSSTRTYPKGAKVIGSNFLYYISQDDSNSGNEPTTDDGTNWRLNNALINPLSALYTNGDESSLPFIEAGLLVDSYEYLVYSESISGYSLWFNDGQTGSFAGDFNDSTGIDSGLSGALNKVQLPKSTKSSISLRSDDLSSGVELRHSGDNLGTYTGLSFSVPPALTSAAGIARDLDGSFWAVGPTADKIIKIDAFGVWTGGGDDIDVSGELTLPTDLAISSSSNIWVVGRSTDKVVEYDKATKLATGREFSVAPLTSPRGLAIDAFDRFLVVGLDLDKMLMFSPAGVYASGYDMDVSGELTEPQGITVDDFGKRIVIGSASDTAFVYDENGEYTSDSFPVSGETGSPTGLNSDSSGSIWVVDAGDVFEYTPAPSSVLSSKFNDIELGVMQIDSETNKAAIPRPLSMPMPLSDLHGVNKKFFNDHVGGQTVASGSATFTNVDNNISLANIGRGVEIGDVLTISGSASNDKEFTIEVITDSDNVIVNQAHAGGTTTKSLVNETANVSVVLLAKWHNAGEGLGQGWVDVTTSRSLDTPYSNDTMRTIDVNVSKIVSNGRARIGLTIDGVTVSKSGTQSTATVFTCVSGTICKGSTYESGSAGVGVALDGALDTWAERR